MVIICFKRLSDISSDSTVLWNTGCSDKSPVNPVYGGIKVCYGMDLMADFWRYSENK